MTAAVDSPPAQVETTTPHTRLVKCALAIEESRAYWERADLDPPAVTSDEKRRAFEELWFGSRSMGWVEVLLGAMRHRFRAFPESLAVLQRWSATGSLRPETRALICHWHLQLTDPIYRAFAGEYLVGRHAASRPEVRRLNVVGWLGEHGVDRWSMATRVQIASKLLSCAYAAGLVTTRRDPRPVAYARVPDDALGYVLHLLRDLRYDGTIEDNPYLRSVGLSGSTLQARLRGLSSLAYQRTGDVTEFGWRHPTLTAWAEAEVLDEPGEGARS